MPFYTIEHSFPLSSSQKKQLAAAITHLHSSKFLVPSMFVHVSFKASDASAENYFIAGKARTSSTNHIVGLVRTSPSRTREDWEALGADIEDAWYTAVNGKIIQEGKDQGRREDSLEDSANTTAAKKLRAVAFHGLLGVRENGTNVPGAGDEKAWLKENMEEFRRQAEAGDELYSELMEEVASREDLKNAYGVKEDPKLQSMLDVSS